MSEEKLNTAQKICAEDAIARNKEKIQKAAQIACESLAKVVECEEKGLPGRLATLNTALAALRILVRPNPGTLAFDLERCHYIGWDTGRRYGKASEVKPGQYVTPQAALDVVTANPPFGEIPVVDAPEPLDPNAPKLVPGEDRHLSNGEAIAILARLAAERKRTVDEVTALEMGARRMLCRAFQKQRNLARRRARRVPPLSPEEELADTIARQKEAE